MRRPSSSISRALLLLAALAATQAATAAGSPGQGDRRTTNTFTMLASAPPAQPAGRGASNGVGIAPSKPVVSNPYNVPLLQNAGSLRAVR